MCVLMVTQENECKIVESNSPKEKIVESILEAASKEEKGNTGKRMNNKASVSKELNAKHIKVFSFSYPFIDHFVFPLWREI